MLFVLAQNRQPGLATRNKIGALAPTAKQALFLRPLFAFMVAVRGRPQGLPGSYLSGSPTCVQPPPLTVWRQLGMAPIK